jgi:hypothetical protein
LILHLSVLLLLLQEQRVLIGHLLILVGLQLLLVTVLHFPLRLSLSLGLLLEKLLLPLCDGLLNSVTA